jgi:hypothetical protein
MGSEESEAPEGGRVLLFTYVAQGWALEPSMSGEQGLLWRQGSGTWLCKYLVAAHIAE